MSKEIQQDQQDMGASADADRATHEQSPQAVSAVPVGIPSAVLDAIEFYAFAENWHGVYMCGHGPMTDDWSDDYDDPQYPDGKPGKLARAAVRWLYEHGYYDELKEQVAADAQAIEARRAETGTGSVHESAVAKPCAQISTPKDTP